MRTLVPIAGLTLVLAVAVPPAAAQEAVPAPAPSCLSDWSCTAVRAPLGLYVRAVDQGGRYLTLEDGSLWEIELPDRATTASWQPDDFVGVRNIWAPRGDFDVLLTRVGDAEQRAAARLAGRRSVAFRSADSVPAGFAEE
jgi:hypothetical protein